MGTLFTRFNGAIYSKGEYIIFVDSDDIITNLIIQNYIAKKYLYKKIIIENDVIILFSLFQISNSFQYIDEVGYYYFIQNNDSITNTRYEPEKANRIIYSIFLNIKFLYEKTKSTNFDKYFCIYKLIQGYDRYKICFKYITNGFRFIKNIFNNLLESNYISENNKLIIRKISKEIFINRTFMI